MEATSVRHEGKKPHYRIQWRCCMLSQQADHHVERYTVPEGISHAGDGLFWHGQCRVTRRSRWSPIYMTHVVEVCMEQSIIVCQLIGNNGLERWRDTNGGWSGWPTLAIQRKSLFLPHLGCGKTVPVSPAAQKKICPTHYLNTPVYQVLLVSVPCSRKSV